MPRNALIQVRRDTAANWTSLNPTLAAGELGVETNTGKLKIGDGATAWTGLLYATDASKITGTTLASNVVSSSLTSLGTVANLQASAATVGTLQATSATATSATINGWAVTKPGSVVVSSGSFSSTSSFDISGFSSTYKDYDLRLKVSAGGSTSLRMALLASGTPYTSPYNVSSAMYHQVGSTTWTISDSSNFGAYIALGGVGLLSCSLDIRLANMLISGTYPTVSSRHTWASRGYIAMGEVQASDYFDGVRVSAPISITGNWVLSGLLEG